MYPYAKKTTQIYPHPKRHTDSPKIHIEKTTQKNLSMLADYGCVSLHKLAIFCIIW